MAITAEDLLRNARWVEALARRLLRGDAHLAEDVVQQTWVAALENPPQQRGALRGWLRTTVRNLAHHARRSESRRTAREARVARSEVDGAGLDDTVVRFERQQFVGRILLELDEPYRTSILLRFYEGLDYEAIGRRTGVPPGTARVRVHRALGQLRERLDGETKGSLSAWLAPLALVPTNKTAAAAATLGVTMKISKSVAALVILLAVALIGGLLAWTLDDSSSEKRSRAESAVIEEASRNSTAGGAATDRGETTESPGDDRVGDSDNESEESPLTQESDFTVDVRVLDPEGAPLRTEVTIFGRGVGRYKLGTLRTDEHGRAHSFVPEEGTYEAEAKRNGSYLRRVVTLSEAESAGEIVLRFPAGSAVHGEIHTTHGAIEKDVRGTMRVLGQTDLLVDLVAVGQAPSDDLPYSRVDADGRYRIEGVAPGDYYLRVPGKFHVEKVTIPERGELLQNILLPVGRITGRARDQVTGAPALSIQVVVSLRATADDRIELLKAAGLPRPSDRCSPADDGTYSFTNLPAGEYALFANGGGYGVRYANTTLPAERPEAEVDFELEMGSFVQLAVRNKAGEDLKQLRVSTQGMSWGFGGRVSGLKAGKWDFYATAPGHELKVRKQVEFMPGEATELTFELAPEARAKITFVDQEGRPVAGVRVSIPRDGYDQQQVIAQLYRDPGLPLSRTDAAGQIVVLGLVPGQYTLQAKKPGYAVVRKEVTLASDVRVTMKAANTKFQFRLRVTSVKDGSQAARHGIQKGAVILSYDGKTIDSLDALRAAVSSARTPSVEMVIREERAERAVTVQRGVLGVGLAEFEDSE